MLLHKASDSWRSPGSLSLQLALLLGLLILLLTLALQPSCLNACISDGMLGTLLLAHCPPASPAGWHAHTYPLPTQKI